MGLNTQGKVAAMGMVWGCCWEPCKGDRGEVEQLPFLVSLQCSNLGSNLLFVGKSWTGSSLLLWEIGGCMSRGWSQGLVERLERLSGKAPRSPFAWIVYSRT